LFEITFEEMLEESVLQLSKAHKKHGQKKEYRFSNIVRHTICIGIGEWRLILPMRTLTSSGFAFHREPVLREEIGTTTSKQNASGLSNTFPRRVRAYTHFGKSKPVFSQASNFTVLESIYEGRLSWSENV